jgi:hypothetical protein
MVGRLTYYLQQPEQMRILRNAARETVIESFSMQKMVNELETIYTDLIN